MFKKNTKKKVEQVLDEAKENMRQPAEEVPPCANCGGVCVDKVFFGQNVTYSMKCHFDLLNKQRLQEVKQLARG